MKHWLIKNVVQTKAMRELLLLTSGLLCLGLIALLYWGGISLFTWLIFE